MRKPRGAGALFLVFPIAIGVSGYLNLRAAYSRSPAAGASVLATSLTVVVLTIVVVAALLAGVLSSGIRREAQLRRRYPDALVLTGRRTPELVSALFAFRPDIHNLAPESRLGYYVTITLQPAGVGLWVGSAGRVMEFANFPQDSVIAIRVGNAEGHAALELQIKDSSSSVTLGIPLSQNSLGGLFIRTRADVARVVDQSRLALGISI
jgi:hypothetical protein